MRRLLLWVSTLLFLCTALLLGGAVTLRQVKEQGMSALVVSHLDIKEPLKDALEQAVVFWSSPSCSSLIRCRRIFRSKQTGHPFWILPDLPLYNV